MKKRVQNHSNWLFVNFQNEFLKILKTNFANKL